MSKRVKALVSVVLVNYRGTDDTLVCIDHLLAMTWPAESLEIIVVENASGDDSVQRLKALGRKINLVESKENLGFAGGCNLGVKNAHGEYVAFLNNDARPDADWIRTAIETFDQHPDVGAVASKVLDWDGENVDFVDASITWYGMGYKPRAGEPYHGDREVEKDVLFGTGAAMFVRRDLYLELGGFDERFFMFYEDVDLGWRINLAGHKFRYQPQSVAYHKHHASMKKFGAYKETYLLERNALYTLYKNLGDESLERVLPAALALAVRRSLARADIDSTQLDLRNPGDSDSDTMTFSKEAAAGVFAIDQFVENLPGLVAARETVQSSRVVSDTDVLPLFGNLDEPAYPIARYLQGYSAIVGALAPLEKLNRTHVLVMTGDPIGQRMAGPAIRAWNFAEQLSRTCDVKLVTWSPVERTSPDFEVLRVEKRDAAAASLLEAWADVIIYQGTSLFPYEALRETDKALVADLYDPMQLEQLEQAKGLNFWSWTTRVRDVTELLNDQLERSDFFLCASDRQRSFWLGQLSAMGRLNPANYRPDKTMKSLIDIVPFGLDSKDPVQTRHGIKGTVPGISENDKVIVWGGGIYEWFDTETLVRAMKLVAIEHPEVKLFFMAAVHPNPEVPVMPIVARTQKLAADLGLLGKNVFFNEQWVVYEDRQNYLLDADLGISTHFDHLETSFSFRTRILDYLWAGLPIVSTDGDGFADIIHERGLGATVPARDVAALVAAIKKTLFDEDFAAKSRAAIAETRKEFTWEKVTEPLVRFCASPRLAADTEMGTSHATGKRGRRHVATGKLRMIYAMPRGRQRDFALIRFYLKEGGIGLVFEKMRTRMARKD